MNICKICQKEFPNWIKINGVLKNISSRKYCFECSPYGKHNTRKLPLLLSNGKRRCPYCSIEKDISQFLKRKNKIGGSSYCQSCTSRRMRERGNLLKQKCVEYKNNKCYICGYNKYIGAMDFHHIDPTRKEFNISEFRSFTFGDKVRYELDKCILVCSNCHREIHGNIVSI